MVCGLWAPGGIAGIAASNVAQFVLARHARCNAQRTLMKHARDIAAHPPTGDAAKPRMGVCGWLRHSDLFFGTNKVAAVRSSHQVPARVQQGHSVCPQLPVGTVCSQCIVSLKAADPVQVTSALGSRWPRVVMQLLPSNNATQHPIVAGNMRATVIAYIHVYIHAHCVRANLL